MNIQEYLLSQLGEECSEISQMCSKSNRFGLDDVYDNVAKNPNAYNNRVRLVEEINDLFGIIEELKARGILPKKLVSEAKVKAKRRKVLKYLAHAIDLGTVKASSAAAERLRCLSASWKRSSINL